ncbi:MAG: hypothetical protein MJ089_08360 [Ruminococcus sp.]|nr:hypothetical protein [Ruminococcus sp.]
MLFSQTKNYLTYKNSVFTFEKIGTSHNDLTDDEEDNYGDKKFGLTKSGLPLGKVMNIVVPISNSIFGNLNFRNMKKYYIKSHNGLYLTYNDWHTSTKLIFSTEKTNKSEWFIEMENNGNITFTPAGSKQYTWFAIDVPNATQKTNKIPMWIFVKNDSKAQKFKLHKVIR